MFYSYAKITANSKVTYQEAKKAFLGLTFMASPTDFYSEEFAVEKFGPGLEKVKIKVRISQVYTTEKNDDMHFDLKILVIQDPVKMIPLRDLLMHLGPKTPNLFVGVSRNLSDQYL